jgi:hypothetical protein
MGSPLDYENEFQFQFQLEIVSSGETSQQIENAAVHTKPSHIRTYRNGKLSGFTGARPPDSQDIWGRGFVSNSNSGSPHSFWRQGTLNGDSILSGAWQSFP